MRFSPFQSLFGPLHIFTMKLWSLPSFYNVNAQKVSTFSNMGKQQGKVILCVENQFSTCNSSVIEYHDAPDGHIMAIMMVMLKQEQSC